VIAISPKLLHNVATTVE